MLAQKAIHPGGFQLTRMSAPFQPIPYAAPRHAPARRRMGQIQFNPTVQAPITVELGSLPLSIGLFAGSGVSFLIGAQVPSIRGLMTVSGVTLAGFGVINLFLPKKKPGESGPPAGAAVSPGSTSGPLPPTDESGYVAVEGSIISPGNYETIDVSPIGQPKIPSRVRLSNISSSPANFDLFIDTRETPHPFGAEITSQQTMRIALGPGETRDFDMAVPINSWDALVDYVEVDLTIRKRRFAGGDADLLDSLMFVVE